MRKRRTQSGGGLVTAIALFAIIGGFGVLVFANSQPTQPLQVIVPTQLEPTAEENAWQSVLQAGFADEETPLPTVALPDEPFVAPTLIPDDADTGEATVVAAELLGRELFTQAPVSTGVPPTQPPASPTFANQSDLEDSVTVQAVQRQPTIPWQPPPLQPPLNRDPLGRDHYFFARPIDSDGQNFGIFYYPYGSNGRELNNPLRVHHGIDMPNPIGTTVRAAGSGTVYFASNPENPTYQGSASYGNVVVIEHDFGWQGQDLFTLYAHLQAPLVQAGDRVEMGDPIALNGNTGGASGAHVHFEVRVGDNTYGSTYNPVLWMVPYVGHGTIAGRLIDEDGRMLNDYGITLRNWSTGLVEVASAPTYIFDDTVDQVNSDPVWQENFVFGDVPVGRYEVITNYGGQRIIEVVDVFEGRTTFVELKPDENIPIAQSTPTLAPEAADAEAADS